MLTRTQRLSVLLVIFLLGTWPAIAQETRIALLIGNQAYDPAVGVLKNPYNDVAIVAKALEQRGFEILPVVKDGRRTAILGAVREFSRKLAAGGAGAVGFLYYSGHGAAEKDTNVNYLIPVDAEEPGSSAFWDESVKLDDVLRLLEGARNAVKFVVFDACRSELQLPSKDTSKGLVPVAETQGFFVAYSSAPGRTASDRGIGSGPYAAALAKELGRQGLDHLNLFQNVKETVIASTGGLQQPWESNGLTRRVYLTGEPSMPAEIALWESVRSSSDIAALETFIQRFPNGVFSTTAAQMIDRLKAEAAQRSAAQHFEIERKAQEAKQLAELQRALDDARKARDALSQAEARRLEAEKLAENEKSAVATAVAERNAAAAREDELRKAQERTKSEQTGTQNQTEAERTAAAAEFERKLMAAETDARTAREALAAAVARQKAAEQAALDAKVASEAASKQDAAVEVAALPGAARGLAVGPAPTVEELPRRLQGELKRVGCYAGEPDGVWGAGSRQALADFVKAAGFTITNTEPSQDTWAAVSSQRGRVCRLTCGTDEVEQGGRCVPKADRTTSAVQQPKSRVSERASGQITSASDGSTSHSKGGYQTCGKNGCQWVPKGCHTDWGGGHGLGGKIVCP